MDVLLYSLASSKNLSIGVGFLAVIIETFIPILPILAIVIANSVLLGLWLGFFISWIGSTLASTLLYFISNKFSQLIYIQRALNKDKSKKVVKWIKNQNTFTICIAYLCPFIPDFVITITSGFTKLKFRKFFIGMCTGKFFIFLLMSYIGEDIKKFTNSPLKLTLILLVFILLIFISQRLNKSIYKDTDE